MRKKVGDFIIEELIGSGAYGEVYKGTNAKFPNELFAIKVIPKKNMSSKVYAYLEREVEILQLLDHENIMKLRDIKATDNHYYLIFEYCNGGDLQLYRKKKGGIVEEGFTRHIAKQMVAGLDVLYQKKTIHRDIKLSNILLHYPTEEAKTKDRPVVKIGDFGFARLITQVDGLDPSISEKSVPMSFVGTPLNMAPELFHKKPYSFKADIWSLGTILYELLCGQNCFIGLNKEDLMHNIDKGTYKIPKALGLSAECYDFLNACLQLNPSTRIKWKLLREHPFIKTETKTPFSPGDFAALNKDTLPVFDDSAHFIFNSKVRSSFSPIPKAEIKTKEEEIKIEDLITKKVQEIALGDSKEEKKTKTEEKKEVGNSEDDYEKVSKADVESDDGLKEYSVTKEAPKIEEQYFG